MVFGLVIGAVYIERESQRAGVERGLVWAGVSFVSLNVPLAIVHAAYPGQMEAHAPYWLMPLISVLAFVVLWWRARRVGKVEMSSLVLVQGAAMAMLALYYVVLWTSGDHWTAPKHPLAPGELAIIPGIALACTVAVAAAFWALSRRWTDAKAFFTPVALLLFASHFLDGTETYRGLDIHGYSEKHVIPSLLIDATGTAAVMLPLKFLVVTAVVYLLDIAYKEDLKETPVLGWLVKVAIMVLGLAPGIRDMLRLAMGM